MSSTHRRDGALGKRLLVDVSSALIAAVSFTPLAAIVDTAIVRSANGTEPNMAAGIVRAIVAAARNPVAFVKDKRFLGVYGVYSATYGVSNVMATVVDSTSAIVAFTATTNIATSIMKDELISKLTRPSGMGPPPRAPVVSYGAWGARDAMTVVTSFVLVPPASLHLSAFTGMGETTSMNICQFALPVGVQWLSTPVHLLGLDFYNHQARLGAQRTMAQRLALVRREYRLSATARSLRIAAAFGIGGVSNRMVYDAVANVILGPVA